MTLFDIVPIVAAVIILGLVAALVARRQVRWIIPACFSAGFAVWSLFAVLTEGPLGFWTEHVRNAWGNQIWMDLLLAVGMALIWLVPAARAVGVRPLPWVAFTLATGSIGLCAFAARVLYLRDRAAAP
ncbi:hypothetical protein [Pseudooctadecabacter sp.]|uniref:hypothetical protein n=1 Tax=Pseudooctadecabacter sp. TaxID=1966338 RepID=UPI0035C7DE7F